jgi:hypothetical protein
MMELIMPPKASKERTSKAAASAAGRTLRSPTTSKSAKSAAGSALTQKGSNEVTSKKSASAARQPKTLIALFSAGFTLLDWPARKSGRA